MKIRRYKIDKEGYRIIANTIIIFLGIFGVLFFFGLNYIEWVIYPVLIFSILFISFVIRFFRIPARKLIERPDVVLSPADGKIVAIEKVFVDEFLNEERMQISIFMSIWNVHANWFPVGGKLEYFKHHHGRFIVANNPKSSTLNERTTFVINNNGDKILFRQIAGYVARRIVSYCEVGKDVRQNQRCGFIKFGSRLDVFVPLDYTLNVKLHDRVVATETALAQK